MNTYQKGKERARQDAIDWLNDFPNHNYSYLELMEWQIYFEDLAERYGLKKEFQENGII